jgi:hypothetical protein
MKKLIIIIGCTLTAVAQAEDWNPFLGKKDAPNTPYSLQLSDSEEQMQQNKIKRQIDGAAKREAELKVEAQYKAAAEREAAEIKAYRGVPSRAFMERFGPESETLSTLKEANRLAEEQVQVLQAIQNDAYSRELYRTKKP